MPNHYQDDETRLWHKASTRSLFWVLALTSLVRGGFLMASHASLRRDPDAYRTLADNVRTTGVYGWKTDAVKDGDGTAGDKVRPTAFRPPLYPLLLIGIGGPNNLWSIAIFHWLLGVGTATLVTCLGWRAGLGRWSIAAALLVAIDPILLQQSTLVMTETLATFLTTLALFCLTPPATPGPSEAASVRRHLVAGVVLGLCVLCRPTFLPWLCLIALARLVPAGMTLRWQTGVAPTRADGATGYGAAGQDDGARPRQIARAGNAANARFPGQPLVARSLQVGALVAAALLVIAPWVIRNQKVFGTAKLTTTHGGYTVLLGNNPLFYGFLQSGSAETWDGEQLSRAWRGRSLTAGAEDEQWDDLPELARRAEHQAVGDGSELADDALAYALAGRYMREQPGMAAYASGLRITRLWRCLPHRLGPSESRLRQTLRFAVGVWYVLVYGLAVLGMARLGRELFHPPWLFGLQLCFVITAVHALYWSDMRMRAPLIPLVCLLAARGMAAISDQLQKRNTKHAKDLSH